MSDVERDSEEELVDVCIDSKNGLQDPGHCCHCLLNTLGGSREGGGHGNGEPQENATAGRWCDGFGFGGGRGDEKN